MIVIGASEIADITAAPWASTAGNKFREVARTTETSTTKLLAEGLTALTEALGNSTIGSAKSSSRRSGTKATTAAVVASCR